MIESRGLSPDPAADGAAPGTRVHRPRPRSNPHGRSMRSYAGIGAAARTYARLRPTTRSSSTGILEDRAFEEGFMLTPLQELRRRAAVRTPWPTRLYRHVNTTSILVERLRDSNLPGPESVTLRRTAVHLVPPVTLAELLTSRTSAFAIVSRESDCFGYEALMRYAVVLVLGVGLLVGAPVSRAQAPSQKPLDIYFIDVEGGQATLLVAPSGESMLVDTGFPGNEGRDLARIESAAKQAGVSRIDYLVITHYHTDHVGKRAGARAAHSHPDLRRSRPDGRDGKHRALRCLRRGPEDRASSAGQAGRQDSDRRARRDGRRGRRPGPRHAASRRRRRQPALRGTQAEGRGPFGERAIGRDRDRLRAFPDARPRRSHLEQGARSGVPGQPDRADRSLPDDAPRRRYVGARGPRAGRGARGSRS